MGSPSSIRASRTASFATDLPGGQATVHVLNQSTEALDRICWAFSCQPPTGPTGPIDFDGTATGWSRNVTLPSLPDFAATERELAKLSEAPVHTYPFVDFTDEQLCQGCEPCDGPTIWPNAD